MERINVKNTDLKVSRIALGTCHLGGGWDHQPVTAPDRQRTLAILEAAVDHGINHIDLADIYTFGKSDETVGWSLAKRPGLRDRMILQEKCGVVIASRDGPPQRLDLSFDHIIGSVETSLRRLRTDIVDILSLHRPDPLMEPDEVARALDQLHTQGKVRYFGVSNFSEPQTALLQRSLTVPLISNQLELSVARNALVSEGLDVNLPQSNATHAEGLLDACRLREMLVQAWSPLAGGAVFEGKLGEALRTVGDEHGVGPEAIALAWIMRHPANIQPVIGPTRPERLSGMVEATKVELDRMAWYQLLEVARGRAVP